MHRLIMATVWVCLCACLWVGSWADICDRRDRRKDIRRWKGDIGDLEMFPGGRVRDRLQLKHRVRRFLSFPTGSVLTVTPKLTIPFYDEFDGYITGAQLYAVAFDLALPNATLRLRKFKEDDPMTYTSYGSGSSYGSRLGRSLDSQRVAGFNLLQKLMDTMGLAGEECMLRAVCEVAERPVDNLGITGEIINLFFSAGYGGGSEEVKEYVKAEEVGRREGDCETKYSSCPYPLASMVESALTHLHLGLAQAAPLSIT
ncbi:hypothetical protein Pmani_014363 [Petrolisthes manimaculis]|uniref:Uncharacterized protein n=1 Tax=Petrolisthes manimaculis TaxID=1843537 RepID=A0AAE1UB12_9EUCA|nr:hypothetical protein Pmani_014363 [Petrolisthes manimaculis]